MIRPQLSDKVISDLTSKDNMRELCALMLYEVYENGAYTNLVLKKCDQIAGGRNLHIRSLRAMLYGTVTYTYTIDFLIKHIAKRDVSELDGFVRTLLRFGSWQILFSTQIPVFAAVSETVNIADKYCPNAKGLINAVLRKIAEAPEEDRDPDRFRPDVACSLKSEIYGIFKRDYGKERALDIGKAFLRQPKLTIRFDPSKISAEELEIRLAEESFSVFPGAVLPEIRTVDAGISGLERSECFRDGLFFVQNEAAAIASHIAAPKKGMKILDCCAAPGGKATHLSELTNGESDILALDINSSRMELLAQNIRRLGIGNIRTDICDATDMSGLKEEFDIVLADCPCSGLGLIGRKPDIRLNITYDKIKELIDVQKMIIREAASKVKVGGAFIYCTCTVNKDENERQILKFLEENSNFRASSILPYLPSEMIIDDGRKEDAKNGYLTLLPDTDGCDGFFISRIERIS